MEKVIIKKKNGVSISLPWVIVRELDNIIGLYKKYDNSFLQSIIMFNKNVNEVVFENCRFDSTLDLILSEEQKLSFVDCVFEEMLTISGGKLDISNSSIRSSLEISNCSSVSLDSSGTDTYELGYIKLNISGDNVCLNNFSNAGAFDIDIISNDLNITNSNLVSNRICLGANNHLCIKNSIIDYLSFSVNYYDKLTMDNVKFISEHGLGGYLYFKKIIGGNIRDGLIFEDVATYYRQMELTDNDLADLKQQSIYSLLSVLKGYSKKMSEVNNADIEKVSSEISADYDIRIREIEEQQRQLEIQKETLSSDKSRAMGHVKENMSKRKIKTLV